MTIRLAFRLVRGGGVAGAVRLALVVVGIALGVTVGTLVAVLPGILQGRADVMNARSPSSPGPSAVAQYRFSTSTDIWDGTPLGRTFLADVKGTMPRPPGVQAIPGPGEVVVSPALSRLLVNDPAVAALVPGRVTGLIGPQGLVSPEELFAYIRVDGDQLSDASSGAGFGSKDTLALETQQAGLTESLMLLLLPPVIVYLVVCGRLAATARLRRYAALRLVGLRRRQILSVAFVESAAAGMVGAGLGVLIFRLVHPVLAGSGLLGFSWYPSSADLTTGAVVGLMATVTMISGLVGAVGLRRSLDRPLFARVDGSEPGGRVWQLLPLAAGFGATAYLLTALRRPAGPDVRISMGDSTWLAVTAVVVLVGGVMIGLRPIIHGVALLMRRPRAPLVARLAGARLAAQPAATIRLLAGLALLVVVSGVGSGVFRDLELRSTPAGSSVNAELEGSSVPEPAAMQKIYDLPSRYRWTVQNSVVSDAPGDTATGSVSVQARVAGYSLITMTCASLRQLYASSSGSCRDGGWYRLASEGIAGTDFEVPAGAEFEYRTADGGRLERVSVPKERIVVPDDSLFPVKAYGGLLYAHDGPAWQWGSDSSANFLVDPSPQVLGDFKLGVAAISPAARLRVWDENLDLMELARNQRGVVRFGVAMGFLVGLLAFGVSALDNAVACRRDVAVLMVVGMRRRLIRRTQMLQLTVALVVVLLLATATGLLAGNVALRINDVNRPWFTAGLSQMLLLTGVSMLVGAVSGGVVVVRRLRSDDLKRE